MFLGNLSHILAMIIGDADVNEFWKRLGHINEKTMTLQLNYKITFSLCRASISLLKACSCAILNHWCDLAHLKTTFCVFTSCSCGLDLFRLGLINAFQNYENIAYTPHLLTDDDIAWNIAWKKTRPRNRVKMNSSKRIESPTNRPERWTYLSMSCWMLVLKSLDLSSDWSLVAVLWWFRVICMSYWPIYIL